MSGLGGGLWSSVATLVVDCVDVVLEQSEGVCSEVLLQPEGVERPDLVGSFLHNTDGIVLQVSGKTSAGAISEIREENVE